MNPNAAVKIITTAIEFLASKHGVTVAAICAAIAANDQVIKSQVEQLVNVGIDVANGMVA